MRNPITSFFDPKRGVQGVPAQQIGAKVLKISKALIASYDCITYIVRQPSLRCHRTLWQHGVRGTLTYKHFAFREQKSHHSSRRPLSHIGQQRRGPPLQLHKSSRLYDVHQLQLQLQPRYSAQVGAGWQIVCHIRNMCHSPGGREAGHIFMRTVLTT